ncbi:MAG: hypothetical protein OHK0053_22970 [Microscillaceae bacterium]
MDSANTAARMLALGGGNPTRAQSVGMVSSISKEKATEDKPKIRKLPASLHLKRIFKWQGTAIPIPSKTNIHKA